MMESASSVPPMIINDTAYQQQVLALLEAAHGHMESHPQRKLCLFIPRTGSSYPGQRKLMIVGRAVNGWDHHLTAERVANADDRATFLERVLKYENGPNGNMTWVEDHWPRPKGKYSTSRSAFWRMNRKVAAHFGIEEPGWSKHLAWTNLYKLAPAGGGNPSGELCRAQFAACKRLLRMEVERLKPSIVLALTGWGWIEPFLGELGAEVKATGGSLVAAAGTIGDSRFVVAEHPQRKPEGEMVREVMRALKGV